MMQPQNNNKNWNYFYIYKLLIIIFTFKIFSFVLKRLVRMNFNGLQTLKLPLVT